MPPFSPMNRQEKHVFFIRDSEIFSKDRKILFAPRLREWFLRLRMRPPAPSAWRVAVERGLEEQPGDGREGWPLSLPSHWFS